MHEWMADLHKAHGSKYSTQQFTKLMHFYYESDVIEFMIDVY